MKTSLTTVICFLLMGMAAFSQDIIIYKNGIELKARVTEITSTEVRYKSFDNLNGPVYSSPKADIFMVKYENGSKDVFTLSPVPQNVPVAAEEKDAQPEIRHYGGPRLGVTFAGPGILADDLSAQGKGNIFSQFGWQFETRMFTTDNGISGLLELVPLISMVDMGKFTPSVTGIVGIRGKEGLEFGVGPSYSLYRGAGQNGYPRTQGSFGIVIAIGVSGKAGKACFPMNIAIEPSVTKRVTTSTYTYNNVTGVGTNTSKTFDLKTGVKVSLLIGFNSRTN